jgi:hypothetical protein
MTPAAVAPRTRPTLPPMLALRSRGRPSKGLRTLREGSHLREALERGVSDAAGRAAKRATLLPLSALLPLCRQPGEPLEGAASRTPSARWFPARPGTHRSHRASVARRPLAGPDSTRPRRTADGRRRARSPRRSGRASGGRARDNGSGCRRDSATAGHLGCESFGPARSAAPARNNQRKRPCPRRKAPAAPPTRAHHRACEKAYRPNAPSKDAGTSVLRNAEARAGVQEQCGMAQDLEARRASGRQPAVEVDDLGQVLRRCR